jgi:sulfide:quinone oxidoreductase
MPRPVIQPRRVLITGGGVAAVEALMALADRGERQLHITVAADRDRFHLRPQQIGELWGGPAIQLDLPELAAQFNATFTREALVSVDAERQTAVMASGARVGYDDLLVAVGAAVSLPYAGAQTLGFGSLPGALAAGAAGTVAIVVPPGTGWTLPAYQLAVQIAASAPGRVTVDTPEHVPLAVFGEEASVAVNQFMRNHDVRLTTHANVPIGMDVADLADTVLSLPLLHGPAIAGLPATAAGFHRVDELQRVDGLANVYVAGDATAGEIKQGGLAAQQAEAAASHIAHRAGAPLEPTPYDPVLRGKLSALDGETLYLRRALRHDEPGRASSRPLWRPAGMLCAWRLSGWLDINRDELDGDPLEAVARPWRQQPLRSSSSSR